MSYLDDADHSWELEELPEGPNGGPDLDSMIKELADRELFIPEIDLILQGYEGLKARHPNASRAQCLHTSMVWYFG